MYPLWNNDKFFYKISKNKIRIGVDDKNSWEIEDENGLWEKVIKLCNGQNNVNDIFVKINKVICLDSLKKH